MVPKVTIELQNGALGSLGGTNDGVAGIVIGVDPEDTEISAGAKFVLNSIDDAIINKLDDIPYAYQQIKDFYQEAGVGAKLYVLIAPNTETLTNLADTASTNFYGRKLLEYAGGEIKILGVCRKPAAGYTATTIKGMDDDSIVAIAKLQALAEAYFALYTPFVGIVEGRKYQGVAASLDDLTEGSANYVGVVLSSSSELYAIDADGASVGLALGRAASVPVQRKIARVKDGGLAITQGYLGAKKTEEADFASVAEKGYITIGMYANKTGYYFLDDTLATASTDDYKTVSQRRTMNKMVRLVYSTYINELNDDIELTEEGKLSPATAKYYQGLIENAINSNMTAAEELSSFSAFVDINQNVLSTGRIDIKCSAVPKGYAQEIKVVLGFSNPALSA